MYSGIMLLRCIQIYTQIYNMVRLEDMLIYVPSHTPRQIDALDMRKWCQSLVIAVVKISAIWFVDDTWRSTSRLSWSFFQIKWQSTSICFLHSWKLGFKVIWIALMLLTFRGMGGTLMPSSLSSPTRHLISEDNTIYLQLMILKPDLTSSISRK